MPIMKIIVSDKVEKRVTKNFVMRLVPRQYFFSLKRADFVEQKIMSRPVVKFFDRQ